MDGLDNLETIKEFDFRIGEGDGVDRVSRIPDNVQESEINFLLWLILERELGNIDKNSSVAADVLKRRTQTDGGRREASGSSSSIVRARALSSDDTDALDSSNVSSRSNCNQIGYGFPKKLIRKLSAQQNQARKYAETLLRQAGIQIPFDQLSSQEKQNLFQQFSSSSNLLNGRSFGSTPELFTALRERSKFREEFVSEKEIGSGTYGDVFAVIDKATGDRYAIKRVSLTMNNLEELRMTLNESNVLKSLKGHVNVVQCHTTWLEMEYEHLNHCHDGDSGFDVDVDEEEEPLKFYVQMDLCFENLSDWIQTLKYKPDESTVYSILAQLMNAIEFIHGRGILHLDLNTRNVLWADRSRSIIKVSDFGLAIKGNRFSGRSGSYPYSAPEEVHTVKSDIYSIGVTIFEVGEKIVTINELSTRLSENKIHSEHSFLNNILPILLNKNPERRPTAFHFKTQLMLR